MKTILVLGAGLMGPAMVLDAMADDEVKQVIVADVNAASIQNCQRRLAGKIGADKVAGATLDVNDRHSTEALMVQANVVLSALPSAASLVAIEAAMRVKVPLVDLTRFDDNRVSELRCESRESSGLIILGCGLEPGLTEIMARHLAEQLDRVDEVHIQCGGIPEKPLPPLGYKIVFGGTLLPLRDSDALVLDEGKLKPVARYSGVEATSFKGVGECEAWHEGFAASLLELPSMKRLKVGTQRTVRWPGYAAKATVLKELGLLSQTPVRVGGTQVVPKQLIDAVLGPFVTMHEGDRDITVFRVDLIGEKDGRSLHLRSEMVDFYDPGQGMTSMARTTGFTASIVGRMVARGQVRAEGLINPEQVISGVLFDGLVNELSAHNIHFDFSTV